MKLTSLVAAGMLAAVPGFAVAQVSAEAETAAAIARIEKLNPQLNAVIAIDPDALAQARAMDRMRMARGPLFGLPILLKDNIEAKARCRPPRAASRSRTTSPVATRRWSRGCALPGP